MASEPESESEPATRCPVCERGTVADLSFDDADGSRPPAQSADSRQVATYSCGHRVRGASLASADQRSLDVERRSAEETVDPPVSDAGNG